MIFIYIYIFERQILLKGKSQTATKQQEQSKKRTNQKQKRGGKEKPRIEKRERQDNKTQDCKETHKSLHETILLLNREPFFARRSAKELKSLEPCITEIAPPLPITSRMFAGSQSPRDLALFVFW